MIQLTACSNQKIIEVPKIIVKTKVEKQSVPGELLDCKDLPKKRIIKMQSDVSILLVELYESAIDCKSKLISVKKLLKEEAYKGLM